FTARAGARPPDPVRPLPVTWRWIRDLDPPPPGRVTPRDGLVLCGRSRAEDHGAALALAHLVGPGDADLVARVVAVQRRGDARRGADAVPPDRRDHVARGQAGVVGPRARLNPFDVRAGDRVPKLLVGRGDLDAQQARGADVDGGRGGAGLDLVR